MCVCVHVPCVSLHYSNAWVSSESSHYWVQRGEALVHLRRSDFEPRWHCWKYPVCRAPSRLCAPPREEEPAAVLSRTAPGTWPFLYVYRVSERKELSKRRAVSHPPLQPTRQTPVVSSRQTGLQSYAWVYFVVIRNLQHSFTSKHCDR